MLTIFRRHKQACKSADKGRQWKRCGCPIHCEGRPWAGAPYTRMALKVTNWEAATEIVRRWDVQGYVDGQGQTPAQGGKSGVTVMEVCEQWQADSSARNLAPATQKKYRIVCDQFRAWCAEKGITFISEITTALAREFRASWKDRPVSGNKKLERFRSLLRFAMDSGWITSNPAAPLKKALEDHPPTMPMSDHNLNKMLEQCEDDERFTLLLEVMRNSGLRISDAIQLVPTSLTSDNRLFLRTMKTGTDVLVPIPDPLASRLRALDPHPSGHWFWNQAKDGTLLDTATGNARRKFNRLQRQAGLKIKGQKGDHLHMLRDAYSVEMLCAGVPVETVAIILGHESPATTTKHYSPWVKARQDALDDAVRKVQERRAEKTKAITKSKLTVIKSA